MRAKILLFVLTALCVAALGRAAVPANLAVDTTTQELALTLNAQGTQIYECRAVAGEAGKYEWGFKAPEADLFDARGNKVGRHFAGPTWELTEGGKVIGKVKAKTDAPDGKGIPWLLLDVAEKSGPGVLGKAVSIQRVNTVGGQTPTEPADASKAGQTRRVDYTATYLFYVAKP